MAVRRFSAHEAEGPLGRPVVAPLETSSVSAELGRGALVVGASEGVGGFVAEGPVGVGDVPPDAVGLDGAGGLPPPSPIGGRLGRGAEDAEEMTWWVLLVEQDALVSEVVDLPGELDVFVSGGGDGVAPGQSVELAVEVGELLVEAVEPVAVLADACGELARSCRRPRRSRPRPSWSSCRWSQAMTLAR
jgi:hypothetical protein